MKKILKIFLVFIVFSSTINSQKVDDKKVLIMWGGWEGHKPQLFVKYVSEWLEKMDYEYVVSKKLEDYTNFKYLSQFDLIIQSVTMSELSKNQEKGLLTAINSGVGIAGAHGGIADSFRKQTNYQFMIGGQFVEHPGKIKKFTVNFLKDELTEGLNDFKIETEQYYMHYDPNIEIIATSKFDGKPFIPNNTDFLLDPTWIDGVVMPVAWKKRYGLGKVFNLSIGHDPEEFKKHPDAWKLLTRGFVWAMRD